MAETGAGARPGALLDRDGVLNAPEFREGRSFAPRRLADFRLYPDAPDAVARLKAAGLAVAVVTNQPDVGAGLMPRAELEAMHAALMARCAVDRIYVCEDTRAEAGPRRKPAPGMLLEAARDLGLDLGRSFMVGDRASDIEAGRRAGCRTVFIDLGYTAEAPPDRPDAVVSGVAEAVDWILATAAAEGQLG